jgi:hypothetical protein
MVMAGRPKATIDWKQVDDYLRAGCDGASIARLMGIHPETLYNACEREHKTLFSAYAQEKRSEGHSLIRAAMFDEAVTKRNTTMLVWLSKTELGMSETQKIDHTTAGDKINIPPIHWVTFKYEDTGDED